MNISILHHDHEGRDCCVLLLIQLRFLKSVSSIIRGRYSDTTIKRLPKFENIDHRLEKPELSLEFLVRFRYNKVIPTVILIKV